MQLQQPLPYLEGWGTGAETASGMGGRESGVNDQLLELKKEKSELCVSKQSGRQSLKSGASDLS